MIDSAERAELREKLSTFSADMALLNANVHTMNPQQPTAERDQQELRRLVVERVLRLLDDHAPVADPVPPARLLEAVVLLHGSAN